MYYWDNDKNEEFLQNCDEEFVRNYRNYRVTHPGDHDFPSYNIKDVLKCGYGIDVECKI